MALPLFTGVGNLVRDPELRFTTAGAPVCTFDIACSERRKNDAGEWEDGAVTFIKVTVWRGLAENCAESLTKGSSVIVLGKLKSKNHEGNDGIKKTYYEVDAENVGVSLNRPVTVTRAPKPNIYVDPWAAPAQSEPPF